MNKCEALLNGPHFSPAAAAAAAPAAAAAASDPDTKAPQMLLKSSSNDLLISSKAPGKKDATGGMAWRARLFQMMIVIW